MSVQLHYDREVTRQMRTIGVLGGMGPQATIFLQQRLVDAVAADDDADHIPLLIDMNPQVPSRLSYILQGEGEDPGPVLVSMAKRLENAGAQALVMPCNTAHHFMTEVQDAVGIPFLNMVDLACRKAAGIVGVDGRVGILASPATDEIGLFKDAFEIFGVDVVYPSNQSAMLAAIQTIKSMGPGKSEEACLKHAAKDCIRQGADALLVGCSEFSLIAHAASGVTPVIDTLDALVERIVKFAGARSRATI
jgi:aspartate racemase